MANSIGSLYIDISAKTAQLETDMAKVKGLLNDVNSSVTAQGNAWGVTTSQVERNLGRFALAVVGMRTLVIGLAHDFRDVAMNVEDIKGISPDTIESVEELRHNVVGMNNDLKVGIATAEAWFANIGKAIGTTAGVVSTWLPESLGGASSDAGVMGFTGVYGQKDKLSPTDIARDRNPENYDKETAAAQQRLAALDQQNDLIGKSLADQYDELKTKSHEYYTESTNDSLDLLSQLKLQEKSKQALADADRKGADLGKQSLTAQNAYTDAIDQQSNVFKSASEQLAGYEQKLASINTQLNQPGDPALDAVHKEAARTDLLNQYVEVWKKAKPLIDQNREAIHQFSTALADDVGNAIIQGDSLNDLWHNIGKTIEQEFVKMQIEAPLIAGLDKAFSGAGLIGDLAGLITGVSPSTTGATGSGMGDIAGEVTHHAAGGSIDGPSWVGEKGPELFVPPSGGGYIVPNDRLGGGGSSGPNITINNHYATGIQRADLAPILAQNNRQVKNDIQQAMKRGGGPARNFGVIS